MKKLLSGMMRLAYVTIIVVLCYGWWVSRQAQHFQTELGPELRERYGFSTGTPYISAGDQNIEVLSVHPTPGGVFDAAGFQNGDIILSTTLTEFYALLAESKGDVVFHVVDGGDGESIEKRDVRTLKIKPLIKPE